MLVLCFRYRERIASCIELINKTKAFLSSALFTYTQIGFSRIVRDTFLLTNAQTNLEAQLE